MAKNTGRYQRRLLVNRWNLAMSLMTMAFGMMFLLWILATLFLRGFEALVADAVHADDAAARQRRRTCSMRSSAVS